MAPKTFIVTGASKGIGAAITQRLLSQSHNVVLAARSQELLEAVKQSHPGQVEYVAGDMTDPSVIETRTILQSEANWQRFRLKSSRLRSRRLAR